MAKFETRSVFYYFMRLKTSRFLVSSASTDDSFYIRLARLAEHLKRQAPTKLFEQKSSLSSFFSEEAAVNNLTFKAKEAMGAMKKPLMIFRPSNRPPTSPSQSNEL